MEAEETEISKEELQSWIADEVHKARLTSPGIRKKYSLLQSLLERRQRQATRFLQLCQSLMVFENTVKELYSQLGLEYTSLDSESDDEDAGTHELHGDPVSQQASKTTGTPPSKPKIEIKLNMNVLARRKHLCWQRGKVAEIITKETGKVKYKVTFEEKGKSLVSGHHLAYDGLPKLDELSIGCRVVVKCPGEKAEFQPGIMAELPGRKNRMRFLVYTDDHTPMYVGLPAIRLVYKPLADPLDDILDEHHKEFIREYLRTWPYPPQTQYKIGQVMHAEYEGTMQKCEVLTVDCSLIEVIFESDQHKEWLYRGSLRLEHMIKMKYSKWKEDKRCT